MQELLERSLTGVGLNDILDILIVTFIIYSLLSFIRETRAQQLLKGLTIIIVAYFAADFLKLHTISWILKGTFTIGIFALIVVFQPEKYDLSKYDYVPVDVLRDYPFIMTYKSYDKDPHKVFEDAGFMPQVRYHSRDDFAVLSMVQRGLGLAILPELTINEFPGDYDTRMLDPEAYRTLGIGIRSVEDAGPLARFVIKYIRENIR